MLNFYTSNMLWLKKALTVEHKKSKFLKIKIYEKRLKTKLFQSVQVQRYNRSSYIECSWLLSCKLQVLIIDE